MKMHSSNLSKLNIMYLELLPGLGANVSEGHVTDLDE